MNKIKTQLIMLFVILICLVCLVVFSLVQMFIIDIISGIVYLIFIIIISIIIYYSIKRSNKKDKDIYDKLFKENNQMIYNGYKRNIS